MTTPVAEQPTDDHLRGGAQTVERAIAILNLFRDGPEGLGISAIARATGLKVSTAHRLVKTLVNEGFMEQDADSERYRLGAALAILGRRVLVTSGLDAAQPILDELGQTSGESVSLSVATHNAVHVVLQSASHQALRFEHPTGGSIDMHASAMGKVLLAFSTTRPGERSAVPLTVFTPTTISTAEQLAAELQLVRRQGFATNHEERYVGVCGVAVPVLDRFGTARYAVGVQGPAVRMTDDRMAEVLPLLQQAARRIGEVSASG